MEQTVLLIDDDEAMRRSTVQALELIGPGFSVAGPMTVSRNRFPSSFSPRSCDMRLTGGCWSSRTSARVPPPVSGTIWKRISLVTEVRMTIVARKDLEPTDFASFIT